MNALISEICISNYIIKDPVPSNVKDQYISEIWYRDNDTLVKPIIQTPRLKIKYGARRFRDDAPYSYCVSMYNRDIDQNIEKFYTMLREFDQYAIKTYNTHRKDWQLNGSLIGVVNKYWSALRRKTTKDEYYLKLKLLADADETMLTTINNDRRERCTPEDIKFGCYSDQYIGPAYIVYNKEGIHPIWHVHQLVISDIEKVFLRDCLLDQITTPYETPRNYMAPPPPPPLPPNFQSPPHIAISQHTPHMSHTSHSQPSIYRSALCKINVSDIQEAMKKLRKNTIAEPAAADSPGDTDNPEDIEESDTDSDHAGVLFTAKDLQEKKKEIQLKTRISIMGESARDFP